MTEKNKAERIKEIRTDISTLTHELENITGKRGICTQCGEEGPFANWGEAHDLICGKCWTKNEIAKAKKKYVHLIGLRVEDLILDSGNRPLQGLKLEGGYTVEVDSDRDGDIWLDLDHRGPGTKLVSLVIPKHHITDQRWPKEYLERIGKELLCACLEALNTGTRVHIDLKELPDRQRY